MDGSPSSKDDVIGWCKNLVKRVEKMTFSKLPRSKSEQSKPSDSEGLKKRQGELCLSSSPRVSLITAEDTFTGHVTIYEIAVNYFTAKGKENPLSRVEKILKDRVRTLSVILN